MTGISQGRRPERHRQSGTPGTVCPSGPTICGPASSCGSPGAGSVPSVASEPGPRWWTMWSPTGGTGPGSSTGPIYRACASIITTRRPPGSWRKSGETADETEGQILREATSAPERERVCLPGRAQGQALGLPTLPPPEESFWGRCARPRGLSNARKSPPSGFQSRWTGDRR